MSYIKLRYINLLSALQFTHNFQPYFWGIFLNCLPFIRYELRIFSLLESATSVNTTQEESTAKTIVLGDTIFQFRREHNISTRQAAQSLSLSESAYILLEEDSSKSTMKRILLKALLKAAFRTEDSQVEIMRTAAPDLIERMERTLTAIQTIEEMIGEGDESLVGLMDIAIVNLVESRDILLGRKTV